MSRRNWKILHFLAPVKCTHTIVNSIDSGCNANTKLPSCCILAHLNGGRKLLFMPSDSIFFHVWHALYRQASICTCYYFWHFLTCHLHVNVYVPNFHVNAHVPTTCPCDLQDWNLKNCSMRIILGGIFPFIFKFGLECPKNQMQNYTIKENSTWEWRLDRSLTESFCRVHFVTNVLQQQLTGMLL